MNCSEIHDEFKIMGEFTCSFCDQQSEDYMRVEKDESCCKNTTVVW